MLQTSWKKKRTKNWSSPPPSRSDNAKNHGGQTICTKLTLPVYV